MRKTLSILLVLLLAVSILPTAAFAEGPTVVLSPQNLRVNGAKIACEKYNIDGSNYFKLRDIAMVLSGTGSRFSVGWDGEKKVISVVTGEAYEPNGSELDLSGGDKSATAVPSTQTLLINGEERGDLSAYNIGGNNFFKLRDLGDALGFQVNYDKESNTAIVISKAAPDPTPWHTVESFITSNTGRNEHFVTTYDESGNILSSFWDYGGYTEQYDYTYNELGYETQNSYRYYSEYDGKIWENTRTTTNEYDKWGLLIKQVTVFGGTGVTESDMAEETYTYDDDGQRIRRESKSGSVYEYTYEDGRCVKEDYDYEEYHSVTTYNYDERGNLLNRHTESTDWDTDDTYTYDEESRELSHSYYDGADMFTSLYTYDAEGRRLRKEYSSPDEDYVIDYTYDAEGNPLCEEYTGSDYTQRTDYTYDPVEGRQTKTIVITYPAATDMRIGVEELTLAVGDGYYLYTEFMPYNSAQESVTWSSSDDSVAEVDDNGYVTAKKAGSAVVTATSENGLTASCKVTVAEEKFVLTLEPATLNLQAGETASVLCSLEIVGNWRSFNSFSFANDYDSEVIVPVWADEWLASGRIYLYITALEAGETSLSVYVRDGNDEIAGRIQILKVTVTDDNTAEKP